MTSVGNEKLGAKKYLENIVKMWTYNNLQEKIEYSQIKIYSKRKALCHKILKKRQEKCEDITIYKKQLNISK